MNQNERDIGGSIPGANIGKALVLLALTAALACANTVSYVGTLSSPEDSTSGLIDVTLASPGILGLRTYGFGGGTNAAGTPIPAGGFDPFAGVFAGTGSTATFINGTSDAFSNYSSFMGCPHQREKWISEAMVCGDITMSLSLGAGMYTVLLTGLSGARALTVQSRASLFRASPAVSRRRSPSVCLRNDRAPAA